MNRRLKLLSEREIYDFCKIKKSGIFGVILQNADDMEKIKKAKAVGLKVYIIAFADEKKSTKYLEKSGIKEGYLYYASKKSVKSLLNEDSIDGFVLQMPSFAGLIWDESFAVAYKKQFDLDLIDNVDKIFDEESELLPAREWYYENTMKFCLRKLILPVLRLCKKYGKDAVFSISNSAPKGLQNIIAKELNLYKVKSLINEDGRLTFLENDDKTDKDVLVIFPKRFILQSYICGVRLDKIESPLLLSLFEEDYYEKSLEKCGYTYFSLPEQELKRVKRKDIIKYSNIIICESCIFEKSELSKIKYAQGKGVLIDDKLLLDELDRVNQ